VEAKRQARKQREQDAAAAAAAAKRPVGRPKGKPGPAVPGPAAAAAPQQLVWVRIVCHAGEARSSAAGGDIALMGFRSKPFGKSWTLVLAPRKCFGKPWKLGSNS
jgi:hypothetical protein